ncbi:ester cyclase [Gordonia sp. CPCC 205515]|uniref:ester cyclase n=1 Tax=Gordonia sp. CPCC 205515 TaxID=3140791 RepID=UPI003AF3FC9D
MTGILDQVTTAWAKAWGQGDTTAFESITAPDYHRQSKTGPETLTDVLHQIEEQHAAFSDFTVRLRTAVEDHGIIAIHWESCGTHSGEFMGVPPTGRTVTVSGASFINHRDGLITSEEVVWDPRELLSALGIWHLTTPQRSGV